MFCQLVIVASIAAIAGRYAGARDLERLQLRWLVAAFGSIAVAISLGLLIVIAFDPEGNVSWVPASLAFLLPPIAIGIAVTALPPVRDRPAHQPRPVVGGGQRIAARGLRRRRSSCSRPSSAT